MRRITCRYKRRRRCVIRVRRRDSRGGYDQVRIIFERGRCDSDSDRRRRSSHRRKVSSVRVSGKLRKRSVIRRNRARVSVGQPRSWIDWRRDSCVRVVRRRCICRWQSGYSRSSRHSRCRDHARARGQVVEDTYLRKAVVASARGRSTIHSINR